MTYLADPDPTHVPEVTRWGLEEVATPPGRITRGARSRARDAWSFVNAPDVRVFLIAVALATLAIAVYGEPRSGWVAVASHLVVLAALVLAHLGGVRLHRASMVRHRDAIRCAIDTCEASAEFLGGYRGSLGVISAKAAALELRVMLADLESLRAGTTGGGPQ